MVALFRRHRSDPEFRAAVDDMAAATGLSLSDSELGTELDEVLLLARYKRAQARLHRPTWHSNDSAVPTPPSGTRR
ncbi:MAG: hypothetical protein WKG00_22735 [Polyangiaceae bacterium]